MNNALPDLTIDDIKCNILLIGKTGTGKSSFANYLFGVDKFTTGSGEPVTKWEENFQVYKLTISDIQVNIFDSVGLESNNYEKWMSELTQFLSERQVINNSSILSANNIMHVLFYVVNGASARLLDQEKEILLNMRNKYKLPIIIIITNCDLADEDQIISIEKEAIKISLETIRVSSIAKKTRGSEKKEQFGKEKALRRILESSYEKVGKELTIVIIKRLIYFINNINSQINQKIESSNISIINIDKIEEMGNSIINELNISSEMFNDIESFLPKEYINYYKFIDYFSVEYQGYNIFENSFIEITKIIDSFDIDNIKIIKLMNKALDDLENGNFLDKMGALFIIGKKALLIKNTLKDISDEFFLNIINVLTSQLRKIEEFKFNY